MASEEEFGWVLIGLGKGEIGGRGRGLNGDEGYDYDDVWKMVMSMVKWYKWHDEYKQWEENPHWLRGSILYLFNYFI